MPAAEFTSHALVYGIAPSWTNCITYMQLMPWDLKTIWAHNSRWIVVRQPLSQISMGFLTIPPVWTNFSMGEIVRCQCDIAILEINIHHFSLFIIIIASPPYPPPKKKEVSFSKMLFEIWWSSLLGALYSLHPTPVSLHLLHLPNLDSGTNPPQSFFPCHCCCRRWHLRGFWDGRNTWMVPWLKLCKS